MNHPLICEVTRGTMTESRHRVHAMICDPGGVRGQWGDAALMLYPRSAIKFMQALPLIESGAADAFGISEAELALASASHSGASEHVGAVAAWLQRLDLAPDHLGCGAHLPYDEQATAELLRAGSAPSRLHNNCSGKHTGFLTTAMHLGEPLDGYLQPSHPVQTRLYEILSEFGGEDLMATGRGVDGCGIPVYGMTLQGLARAVQRLARPDGFAPSRQTAIRRILAAVRAHPYLVAGRGRFDTDVMRAAGGTLATKGGAEGVHIAVIPDTGTGIAVKAEDGSKRAAEAVMGWILTEIGALPRTAGAALAEHLSPTLSNAAGDPVGTVRVATPS